MMRLELAVRGLPVPQGALVRSPAGGLYHRDGKRLDAWRQAIADAARDEMGTRPLLDGGVIVRARFTWPRPKSNRSFHKLTAPDVDKVARALLDALTGVVFTDDRQVIRLDVAKAWDDATPGVSVVVEEAVS